MQTNKPSESMRCFERCARLETIMDKYKAGSRKFQMKQVWATVMQVDSSTTWWKVGETCGMVLAFQ